LRLADSEAVVLVNRGWVPVGNSRAELPDIPGTDGEVLVDGIVKLPPKRFFRLAAVDETNTGWPKVVQQLEMGELEQLLDSTLEPLILLLDKDDEFGFYRDWKAVYGVTVDKHRAYAMQWFSLAVVLLVIYIGVNSTRIPKEK
jgi:surfeit locus 1 family protein